MTIASEIQRLQTAKNNIRTSVLGKGVTIPDNIKLDDYGTYINCIKTEDHSGGSVAYGLEYSYSATGYTNRGAGISYSEFNDNGDVVGIIKEATIYNSGSGYCNGLHLLVHEKGCMPSITKNYSSCVSDSYTSNRDFIYKHNTNPDCYLIKAGCYDRSTGSGSNRNCSVSYRTLGIDFSVPCMSQIGTGSWCYSGESQGNKNCDNDPPGSDYTYLGENVYATLKSCRGNRDESLLCMKTVCSSHNNYIFAAVFR